MTVLPHVRLPSFGLGLCLVAALAAGACSPSPPAAGRGDAEQQQPAAVEAAGQPRSAPNEVAYAQEALPMLLQPAELEAILSRPKLRVLDARSRAEYDAGHVPGAAWVDVKSWQDQSKADGGFHDGPGWSRLVGPLGVSREDQVVVYGSRLPDTARVWWMLKYLGVEQVALLDGGWQLWTSQGHPVETEPAEIAAAEFQPRFQSDRLEEIDTLKASLGSDAIHVLDTRSTEEFTGQEARGPRGGRIPGATHLEWVELVGDDGRLKSRAELRELFEQRGIKPEQTAITC